MTKADPAFYLVPTPSVRRRPQCIACPGPRIQRAPRDPRSAWEIAGDKLEPVEPPLNTQKTTT